MPYDSFIHHAAAMGLLATLATAILVATHAARWLPGARITALAWAIAGNRR